jgi:hypothetical protein
MTQMVHVEPGFAPAVAACSFEEAGAGLESSQFR